MITWAKNGKYQIYNRFNYLLSSREKDEKAREEAAQARHLLEGWMRSGYGRSVESRWGIPLRKAKYRIPQQGYILPTELRAPIPEGKRENIIDEYKVKPKI